jgi:hypothetical protein
MHCIIGTSIWPDFWTTDYAILKIIYVVSYIYTTCAPV